MQLEKDTIKNNDSLPTYEDIEALFSKKLDTEKKHEENVKEITSENRYVKPIVEEIKDPFSPKKNFIMDKLQIYSKKLNMKYLVTGLLMGIIANISIYHYQSMELQNNSQKLVTGLIYNLSESNDLQQIATNIYLGMKENGWEPSVKISNANIFSFELDKGAEFTITKNETLVNTKFHVQVSNFSNAMVKALLIQLEPNKVGGTKNYINNKKFDPKTNTISFDLDKIGSGILPNITDPMYYQPIPVLPPLPNLPSPKGQMEVPQIYTIPVSPELDKTIIKENKNSNMDKGIIINKELDSKSNIKNNSSMIKKDQEEKK